MGILVLILVIIGAFVVLSLLGSLTFGLIIPILIWMFTGWLANKIINKRSYGVVANMILGLLGGIVGSVVFGILGLYRGDGLIGSIIFGTLGAIIVLFIARIVGENARNA